MARLPQVARLARSLRLGSCWPALRPTLLELSTTFYCKRWRPWTIRVLLAKRATTEAPVSEWIRGFPTQELQGRVLAGAGPSHPGYPAHAIALVRSGRYCTQATFTL